LVTYQAAYGSAVDEADAIHRALDYLVMSNYLLLFNGTNIEDQRFILVDGIFNELGGKVQLHCKNLSVSITF